MHQQQYLVQPTNTQDNLNIQPSKKIWKMEGGTSLAPPPPCLLDKGADWTNGHKATIQSSHMPRRHRHMVIATNLSSLFDLLHCSTPQTGAECCLELTAVSGYRMFLGPFG